jgi:hypothetical protein
MSEPRPVYVLHIQQVQSGTDSVRALRWLLKSMLRRFGFRCLSVSQECTAKAARAPVVEVSNGKSVNTHGENL